MNPCPHCAADFASAPTNNDLYSAQALWHLPRLQGHPRRRLQHVSHRATARDRRVGTRLEYKEWPMTRLVWQLIGTLVVVGFIGAYFWWILAVLAVVVLAWATRRAFREIGAAEVAEAHRRAAIAERADRQHAWRMAGDDRGIYGVAWPDVQKYQREVKR